VVGELAQGQGLIVHHSQAWHQRLLAACLLPECQVQQCFQEPQEVQRSVSSPNSHLPRLPLVRLNCGKCHRLCPRAWEHIRNKIPRFFAGLRSRQTTKAILRMR